MTAIDATGWGHPRSRGRAARFGALVLLCGAREQPSATDEAAEFERHVGAENHMRQHRRSICNVRLKSIASTILDKAATD